MNRRKALSLLSLGATPLLVKGFPTVGQIQNFSGAIPLKSPIKKFGDGRDWFFEKRFGMFIHWGIYSIPAWHEQYQWRANIPANEYVKFARQFNPVKFNPAHFLDLMQEAGMEYLTFTTKHHDGFCMWNTAQTDYNIMYTPYKKDILGMLAEECHKRKVPLCLYYSIVDWHQPNYPNQGRHHELKEIVPGGDPDWGKYMDFLKKQVKELCTNYGEIHGFWWDMNVPEFKDQSVNNMIRNLQPNAIINNRGFDDGDYGTPEREGGASLRTIRFDKPTEACQSVGSLSWGYKKDEEYFSDRYLIRSIDKFLNAGANYLLNVGPTSEGVIPPISANILRRIGKWYKNVKVSYVQAEDISISFADPEIYYSIKGNILYIHLSNDCNADGISLKPIDVLPKSVHLLNNKTEIKCEVKYEPGDYGSSRKGYLRLKNLPVNTLSNTSMVFKLVFEKNISQLI